jgi:hypothetical protein
VRGKKNAPFSSHNTNTAMMNAAEAGVFGGGLERGRGSRRCCVLSNQRLVQQHAAQQLSISRLFCTEIQHLKFLVWGQVAVLSKSLAVFFFCFETFDEP